VPYSGTLKLTCAIIGDPFRSSIVHERIARVLVRAIHLRGVALVFAELEAGSQRKLQLPTNKDEMN